MRQTRASRKTAAPGEALPALPELYFGTSVERFSDRGYLAAALTGVCGMALAGGLAGTLTLSVEGSAGLTVAARIITALTAGAASLLIARYALAERERSLVATIWIALGLMMGTGTVLLALGAGCTYVGGALCAAVLLLLQAHVCYLAVAFASYGERDPYVYAAGAWIALFGFQVLGAALGTLIGAAAPGDPRARYRPDGPLHTRCHPARVYAAAIRPCAQRQLRAHGRVPLLASAGIGG